MTPKRIQRKRSKGWRMPDNTRYVGRGTVYGNPFIVGHDAAFERPWVVYWSDAGPVHSTHLTLEAARSAAVDCFDDWISQDTLDPNRWTPLLIAQHVRLKAALAAGYLNGLDLCCWCPPAHRCHADVLARIVGGAR